MSPLAEQIDALISADNEVVGQPFWQRGAYDGWFRWLATLAIEGEVVPLRLIVEAEPAAPSLRFNIGLLQGASIARLDYGDIDRHFNHEVRGIALPTGVTLGWIIGPHCHLWEDNRMLVGVEPPKELEFARPLPTRVQGFENAFRWFCGEVNVRCPPGLPPELPRRDRLL